MFEACAEHDTAVEINSRPERQDPPDELIALALEIGCLFAIDSDAHAPGQLEMKAYGCERAERLGVPEDRIVTTWEVDRVLAWAGGRGGLIGGRRPVLEFRHLDPYAFASPRRIRAPARWRQGSVDRPVPIV